MRQHLLDLTDRTSRLAFDLGRRGPANAQGHRAGAEIESGDLIPGRSDDAVGLDREIAFAYMGRYGGLVGPALTEDIVTGQWRNRKYEVRVTDAPNDNWFAISDFLDRVTNVGG